MRLALALTIAALAAPAAAQQAQAPFTIAETGQGFAHLEQAVDAIGERRGTILIAPGTYRECAIQHAGHVTFKAIQPGRTILEDHVCEDKAGLVLRGQGSVVDGIVFRGYEVSDGNGAGIRIEEGTLTVVNSMFVDSQEGILGAGDSVTIDRSTFSGLGQCETHDCSHSIYLATKGPVTITRSRFERGTGGHYVKLRVANLTITDSSFDDSAGRGTNYMIDLSEGGAGVIARNTFVQGEDKENWSGFIVVAAEGKTYPSNGLTIAENDASLAPGVDRSPAFIADLSGSTFRILNNRLGPGLREFERRD
jgi:hypothetical protein